MSLQRLSFMIGQISPGPNRLNFLFVKQIATVCPNKSFVTFYCGCVLMSLPISTEMEGHQDNCPAHHWRPWRLQCPQWWPGQSPWRPFDFCIQGYFPSSGVIIWLPDCPSTSEVTLNNMGKCITIDMITITKQSTSKSWTYCQTSNTRCTKSQKCFWSCFTVVFAQSIEARCWVENEDVIGGAPTGDAPTTSERSTILLPIKVHLMLEVLQYFIE